MQAIGFSVGDSEQGTELVSPVQVSSEPVKSLVQVLFPEEERELTYYNENFALKKGDLVFVTGKFAGQLGIVREVNTRFKIRLSDYEYIIACPKVELRGEYELCLDKMLSRGEEAPDADTFRSWVMPPREEDPEDVVIGEGYSLSLNELEASEDVDDAVGKRALQYCMESRVLYLSVRNGVGTAFVRGSQVYEVNFRFHRGEITELYCDCPFPRLCKHSLAAMIELRGISRELGENFCDFTAIDENFFWFLLRSREQKIRL